MKVGEFMGQINELLSVIASNMVYLWGFLALVMVILELSLSGVLQIWFALGAIAAALVAWFFPGSILAQLLVFLIVSFILMFIGSKIFKKEDEGDSKSHNRVYSIIERTANVTKEINNVTGEGQISVGGEQWSAKSKNDTIIPENTTVKVIDIDGVKAVVEVINE